MKRVLYDLLVTQPVAGSQFHGGGEYVKTIFKQLCDHSKKIEIITYYNFDAYMDEWIKELINTNHIRTINIKSHEELMQNGIFDNIDLFFCGLLTPLQYYKPIKDVKVIGIYHGIRSVELPIEKTSIITEFSIKEKIKDFIKLCFRRAYAKKKREGTFAMLEKCDVLIGSSKQSINSVRVNFPTIKSERLRLVYPPIKYSDRLATEKVVDSKYILLLGGNRWIKNIYRSILAIEDLITKGFLKEYSIVVVGGLSKGIRKKIRNIDKYKIYGYVDSAQLEDLYAGCDFFLFPSLNEGYGYPPLEAMRYSKTCVVSGVTSLPEIFGEAVYYCNPYDIGEIETRIIQAVNEKIAPSIIDRKFEYLTSLGEAEIKRLCEDIVNNIVYGKGVIK